MKQDNKERYLRQINLSAIGSEGQKKISASSVLIIGLGGLGNPVLSYLLGAGIGNIGIVDPDEVEVTNLSRQVFFFTSDIGKLKVEVARQKVKELNPEVDIKVYPVKFNLDNGENILAEYDFIIDATDNLKSKYLISDLCVLKAKAFTQAGVNNFGGQIFTYTPSARSGCYRCFYPEAPKKKPLIDNVGVIGPVAGTLGTLQALEAIKYILDYGELLTNRILIYNGKHMTFKIIHFEPDIDCPVCSRKYFIDNKI